MYEGMIIEKPLYWLC